MPWGSLSDRIGRKPIVLIGLASTSIGVLLFGLSKSFTWALGTKIFSGLFVSAYDLVHKNDFLSLILSLQNGNISVLKSMIAELTQNHTPEKRTRAFSLLQVTFGLGSIVGAALGGILLNKSKRHAYLPMHHLFRLFVATRIQISKCIWPSWFYYTFFDRISLLFTLLCCYMPLIFLLGIGTLVYEGNTWHTR